MPLLAHQHHRPRGELIQPLLRCAAAALVAAAVLGGGMASAGSASAAGLSVGVPTAAAFTDPLGTAAPVDTTGGAVSVTALGSWQLRVRGTDGGRLRSTGAGLCANGSALLGNPLGFWASGSGVTSPGSSQSPLTLSGTSQVMASGNVGGLVALAVTVGVIYRYVPSSQDQLPAGCPYSLTATIDLSA